MNDSSRPGSTGAPSDNSSIKNKQSTTKPSDPPYKEVGDNWQLILEEDVISRCVARISYEILERDRDLSRLALVGIRTGGEFLAKRIQAKIKEIENIDVAMGVIDITLYRDDISFHENQPTLRGTELPPISGARIILVDDVLFTGRTVRAALDAIVDFGRPARVELAVLVDRGHREYPIRPDYVGKNIPTHRDEVVRLMLKERGYRDGLYLSKISTLKPGKE